MKGVLIIMNTRFVLYNYTRKSILRPPARLALVTRESYEAYAAQLRELTDELVKVYEVLSTPAESRMIKTPVGFQLCDAA
jgi:hypothetical protein